MLDIAALFFSRNGTAGLSQSSLHWFTAKHWSDVMGVALIISLALVGLDAIGVPALCTYEEHRLRSIDFSDVLMQGMLSFLLFAGALHVDLSELRRYRWQIALLAWVAFSLLRSIDSYQEEMLITQ